MAMLNLRNIRFILWVLVGLTGKDGRPSASKRRMMLCR
jgi:hypothetical protein